MEVDRREKKERNEPLVGIRMEFRAKKSYQIGQWKQDYPEKKTTAVKAKSRLPKPIPIPLPTVAT